MEMSKKAIRAEFRLVYHDCPFSAYLQRREDGSILPLFDKEASEASMAAEVGYNYFDEEKDTFHIENLSSGGWFEAYQGRDYDTVDGMKHLYPLGQQKWNWQLVKIGSLGGEN